MSPRFLGAVSELSPRDLALLVLLVKATIVLVSAFAVTVALQRASAGARHLVWLVALGTLLVVPALTAWAPLRLEILPAAATPASDAATPLPRATPAGSGARIDTRPASTPDRASVPSSSAPAAATPLFARVTAMSVLSLALAVWGFVALAILASLAWSAVVVRRIVRQSRPLDGEGWTGPLYEIADRLELDEAPRLLRSDAAKMPFACGLVRPAIVLPAESDGWNLDRRRAVLLHELAHVRRRDLVGHTLGRLACAFYWFHPLVWSAARALRSESERACDDLALSCGTRAADYAEHLLDIVTSIRRDATPSVALAMARRKEFEGRMLAILDPHLRRSSPSRAQSAALIGSMALVALVVGGAAPAHRVAQAEAPSLSPSRREAGRGSGQSVDHQSVPSVSASRTLEQKVGESGSSSATSEVTSRDTSAAADHPRRVDGVADVAATARLATSRSASELARLLESGAKDSDDRPVLLAKVLRTDASAALRRVAAWGLAEYTDGQVAVDALNAAVLHDADDGVREMAAWALGEADTRRATTTALATALKSDASARVRASAAWALGNIGDRSSVAALVAALGDSSRAVRMRAAWAIGNIGPHEAPAALVALLKDRDPEVRELAAWGLYQIEDASAAPALQAALKAETNKDVQIACIRAIAAMGEKSVDAIRDLLESSDPKIKSMAVRALAGGGATGPWPWPWPDPRPDPVADDR